MKIQTSSTAARLSSRLGGLLLASLASVPAFAVEVIVKPGAPVTSAEFGVALARQWDFTLAAADQDGTSNPQVANNPPGGISARNGTLYMFADGQNSAAYRFGWLHTPERLGFDPVTFNPLQMLLGSQVALSSRWAAASMRYYPLTGLGTPALFLVDMTKPIPVCPTVGDLVDCYGIIEPVLLPETDLTPDRGWFDLKASRYHVAYAGIRSSSNGPEAVIRAMTYNDSTQQWDRPWNDHAVNLAAVPAPDMKVLLALTDDVLVAVVPGGQADNSYVNSAIYTATYNEIQKKWRPLTQVSRPELDTVQTVAINEFEEIVFGEADGSVHFYQCGSSITCTLSHKATVTGTDPVQLVAMDGNQVVVARESSQTVLEIFRKRTYSLTGGAAVESWMPFGGLTRAEVDLWPETIDDSSFMVSDVDISDGMIAIGWRGKNTTVDGVEYKQVGALVRVTAEQLFDPDLDYEGDYPQSFPAAGLTLDERNGLLSNRVGVLPRLGNSEDVGSFGKITGYPGSYSVTWPINLPSSGIYEVCLRSFLGYPGWETIWLRADGTLLTPIFLINAAPAGTGYNFTEDCNLVYMPADRKNLTLRTFSDRPLIDKLTIKIPGQ